MDSRENKPLTRLLSGDGTAELMRFKKIGTYEGWHSYQVTFAGISEDRWLQLQHEADPRDIPYLFELSDGTQVPFARISVIYDRESRQLRTKRRGFYSTSPPGQLHKFLRYFGMPSPEVSQERAPLSWRRPRRRRIMTLWVSDDETYKAMALMEAAPAYRRDLRWVLPLLRDGATHASAIVRTTALKGLGEIARVHGYSDAESFRLVSLGMNDVDEMVRRIATRSLNEIKRFASESRNELRGR